MKLSQLSNSDELSSVVVQKMMSASTALQHAEFYRMIGNAEYARKSATATGGSFRLLNTGYPDNQVNPEFANVQLKILGDMVQVDQAHERRGADIPSVRASELLNFAENLGRQFQMYFFNGNSGMSIDQFDGIKVLCPNSQRITAANNGLAVDMGNSDTAKLKQQKFIELLEHLIEMVDGGAEILYMDGKTLARLSTIAREFITTSPNEFGVPVKYFNGIPVMPAGYDKNGERILPHTESCGTSSTCTSVYAVRYGERSNLSIASNAGVIVKDLGLFNSFYTHVVELDAAPVLLHDKSLARLEGIIIS